MFEINGRIKVINNTVVVSEKFKKREFVLTDETSQYPQDIMFQLAQDNVNKMDGLKVGDVITAKFNLRGKAWNDPKTGQDRYFNTLDCWFVQKGEATAKPSAPAMEVSNDVSDDLPF